MLQTNIVDKKNLCPTKNNDINCFTIKEYDPTDRFNSQFPYEPIKAIIIM